MQQRIDELRFTLPPGVDLVTTYDRSDLIDRAVATLNKTLREEILVVSLVVLFSCCTHARPWLRWSCCRWPFWGRSPPCNFGVSANIMSLGGIAIAIGVMVDSSIIMVEAGHRALEDERRRVADGGDPRPRQDNSRGCGLFSWPIIVLIAADYYAGIFTDFCLGWRIRPLFGPLAMTKTLAMAAAALLSVTLIPIGNAVGIRTNFTTKLVEKDR